MVYFVIQPNTTKKGRSPSSSSSAIWRSPSFLFSSELCVKHVSVGRPSGKVSVEIHAFISQFIQRSQEKNIKMKFPLKK